MHRTGAQRNFAGRSFHPNFCIVSSLSPAHLILRTCAITQPLMQSSAFPCALYPHIIDLTLQMHTSAVSLLDARPRTRLHTVFTCDACLSLAQCFGRVACHRRAVLFVVKALQQLCLLSRARIMIDGDCCCCIAFAGRAVVRTPSSVAVRSSISICIYLD